MAMAILSVNYRSLAKLVYFTKDDDHFVDSEEGISHRKDLEKSNSSSQPQEISGSQPVAIKATGGGAYKYADLFKERLGITLDKKDEMDCLVAGANFLL
ncbi:Pantothenate kinase 2, partial [Mucuna pruriens]